MDDLFFLAYANESFKKDPQSFYKLLEQLDDNARAAGKVINKEDILIDIKEFEKIFTYIVELSKTTDRKTLYSKIEQYGSTNHYNDRFDNNLYHAVLAIAGQRDSYYSLLTIWERRFAEKKAKKKDVEMATKYHREGVFNCDLRKVVARCTDQDLCEESFLLKCYECFQTKFRDCLLQIIAGKEYSKIDSFKDVMLWSEEISSSKTNLLIEEQEEGKPFSETLHSVKMLFPIFYEFANSGLGNSYHVLNDFIFSLASYSLTEFLIKNDRRKLKHCPYCDNFFIARDMKRKHCCYSDVCSKKWERDKKRIQRDKDPVKYV